MAAEIQRVSAERTVNPRHALRVVGNYERFSEAGVAFLLELDRLTEDGDWQRKGEIIRALEILSGRRASGLSEGDLWQSLGLPTGLLRR